MLKQKEIEKLTQLIMEYKLLPANFKPGDEVVAEVIGYENTTDKNRYKIEIVVTKCQ